MKDLHYTKIAHYRVLKKLGEGAMGAVFLGMDDSLEMQVAIKVLSPKVVVNRENITRFEQEARAAAKLRHPNIGNVFFIGITDDGLPFYAMEYIPGVSLEQVVDRRMVLTGDQILNIMVQSCRALQQAANHGVLHRDVKPGNIMIDNSGFVKLVDFGLAKVAHGDQDLTRSGIAMGTPNYLSPEQAKGDPADFRSDMYSLGATFYELLTARPPFISDTSVGVIMKHLNEPVVPLQTYNHRFPRQLCDVVEKMLAKRPQDRYRDFNLIIDDLTKILSRVPDFAETEFAYCPSCNKPSVFKNGVCLACNRQTGEQTIRAKFYGVKINGFESLKAKQALVQWMQRSTKLPAATLEQRLQRLPWVMSPKLEAQRAESLKDRLQGLGVEIELNPVAGTEESSEKIVKTNRLKMPGLRDELGNKNQKQSEVGTEASRNISSSPKARQRKQFMQYTPLRQVEKSRRNYLWRLLGGVVLLGLVVFGALHYQAKLEELEKATQKISKHEQAKVTSRDQQKPTSPKQENQGIQEQAQAEESSKTAQEGTPTADPQETTSLSGKFHLKALPPLEDPTPLFQLAAMLDDTLRKLTPVIGLSLADTQNVAVHTQDDFQAMSQSLGSSLDIHQATMPFSLKQWPVSRKAQSTVEVLWLARRFVPVWLSEVESKTLPLWFEMGIAGLWSYQAYPTLFHPLLARNDIPALPSDPTTWDQGFSTQAERSLIQIMKLFQRMLGTVDIHQLQQVAKDHCQGTPLDEAFKKHTQKTLAEWITDGVQEQPVGKAAPSEETPSSPEANTPADSATP